MSKNLIVLICFLSLLCISFKKDERKFLIYVTLNDSFEFQNVDTNTINNFSCFKIHVDTLNTSDIKRDKKGLFLYKNNYFRYKQLYNLEDSVRIKDVTIDFNEIFFIIGVEPPFRKYKGDCIGVEAKSFLKEYYGTVDLSENSRKFYFEVGAVNKFGENIPLNNIRCLLK